MKTVLVILVVASAAVLSASGVQAQGGAKQQPQVMVDSDLEKDSLHNLEVARHYFKTRKAYVAALQRCEEIIAGNPAFSRLDEVLFMAGESSLNLSAGRGRQQSSLYIVHDGDVKKTLAPDQFRDLARDYFSQLVKSYPDSTFRAQAESQLASLGGPKKQ
jgi:outer membrane protein assembly factor BamD (BamD/ComL family)